MDNSIHMFGSSDMSMTRRNIREAIRGLSVLIRDPQNTAEGFRVIEALDPRIHHRELACISSAPSGTKLLREKPPLLKLLRERSTLEALPEGSLGREYRNFCNREGIEPNVSSRWARLDRRASLTRWSATRRTDSATVTISGT